MIPLTEQLLARYREYCTVPPAALRGIIESANNDALAFAQTLIQDGYLDRDTAGELLAEPLNRAYVNLSKSLFQQDIVDRLPAKLASRYQAMPLYQLGAAVTVGMVEPNDQTIIAALGSFLMLPISPVFSFPDEIESAIKVNYQSSRQLEGLVSNFDLKPYMSGQLTDEKLRELTQSRPLEDIADSIILLGLKERASDIHVEPKKNEVVVRFRIDGRLTDRLFLPKDIALPLVSRYKISAKMDITERRRPQDGRLTFELPMKKLDLRISSLPIMYGEKVVIRILGSLYTNSILNLDKLDFSPVVLRPLKATLKQPQGILVVTGPTGSGKSTTLYAALNFINEPEINVVTIEDPIEYEVPSLNQVMVNDKIGLTFQTVLRAVLRQDPNVIMVGEIRDQETASIATRAAMTGHVVLTTLHTNDSIQATTRLMEMGVERFNVAPSLIGVLSQRLVRRLCNYCKAPYDPEPDTLRQFFFWPDGMTLPKLHKAVGCERCGGTGYSFRFGIHEFLKITPQIREAIMHDRSYEEILALARGQGFHSMRYDGFKKVLRGLTTIEEILHVTAEEED